MAGSGGALVLTCAITLSTMTSADQKHPELTTCIRMGAEHVVMTAAGIPKGSHVSAAKRGHGFGGCHGNGQTRDPVQVSCQIHSGV